MHRPKDKNRLKLVEDRKKESCRRHQRRWSGRSSESKPVTFKTRLEDASRQLDSAIADLQEVI